MADSGNVTEGSLLLAVAASGVLSNDVAGADGFAAGGGVVGVRAAGNDLTTDVTTGVNTPIAGLHGTLVLQANGGYSYKSTANDITADTTDVFVYTVKDGDGDLSTTTLTINLANVTVSATDTDALVNEAGLSIGSNAASDSEIFNGSITPSGGTGPYTYTLNDPSIGSHGTLLLNAATGTYTYTLTSPFDTSPDADNGTNPEVAESFQYTVTDANGVTATGTILVAIIDDIPTAQANTNSVVEGAIVTGNVLTDGTADVFGADGAAPAGGVTGVAAGSNTSLPVSGGVGTGIAGTFGTLTLNADGSYSYDGTPNVVPPAGATDTFVYTITDGDGDTSTVTLTITLTDTSLAASNDDLTVNEAALASGSTPSSTAETVTGTVADNVTPGVAPYTFALVSSPTGTHGTLTFNADGSYSYTLTSTVDGVTADNGITTENNVETFTYQVTDAAGNTATSTITIDVTDDIPTAQANTNSVVEGAIVTGNVLTDGTADVFGADGAAPAGGVTGVAAGSNTSLPVSGGVGTGIAGTFGTLTLNADGSYSYDGTPNVVPPAGATDTFVYTITDGDGDTSTVTLTITLTDTSLAASNDDLTVNEAALASGSTPSSTAETVTGTVADNVTPGVAPYTFALVSSPTGTHGTLTFNADGSYSYTLTSTVDGATADNGITTENNVETFTYQVTDAAGNTATSTITIDVTDDIPTAQANTNSVVEGAIVTGNVLTDGTADVFGADGAAPAGGVTGVAAGSNTSLPVSGGVGTGIAGTFGTLTLNADGSYSYDGTPNVVPPAGATDTFVYTITDGDGDTSTVTLTITLTDTSLAASNDDLTVNEAALASGSTPSSTAETVTGTVADNVTPGVAPYTFALVSSPTGTHGTLTFNADGSYSYTLTSTVDGATADNGITTENNVETFTYQVTDAAGNTATSTITIDVTDDIPTAQANTNSVVEGAIVTGNVLTDGTADVFGADGAAPAGGVTGVAAGSNTSLPVSGGVGTGIAGTFGTLTLNADGSYSYDGTPNVVPPAGATDTFVYTITDGDGDTSTVTLTITLTDTSLAASNDDLTVNEAALASGSTPSSTAETVTGTVADNVTPGVAPYTFALVSSPTGTHGTLTFNADGSYSYTLTSTVDGATADNGITTENNVETFTYQVTDAAGNTATSTITIDVTDDIPTAQANTNSVVEGAIVTGNVLTDGTADVFGADGAAPAGGVTGVAAGSNTSLPVSGGVGTGIAGTFGTLTLNADGSYSYDGTPNVVPPAGATDTFVYTITDGDGDTSTVTLTITLTDTSLAASNDDLTVNEAALASGSTPSSTAETVTGTVADNVTPGVAPYTFALVSSPTGTHGTLTFNADGSYSYTLTSTVDGATADNGITTENNVETFTYQVTDAAGNTATSTITIDVIDDIPTAQANTNSVVEGAIVTGNVLTDGTADVFGADGATPVWRRVTGVAAGSNTSAAGDRWGRGPALPGPSAR